MVLAVCCDKATFIAFHPRMYVAGNHSLYACLCIALLNIVCVALFDLLLYRVWAIAVVLVRLGL